MKLLSQDAQTESPLDLWGVLSRVDCALNMPYLKRGLLAFTFAVAGMAPVMSRIEALPLLRNVPYLYLLLFLPALIVGGIKIALDPGGYRVGPVLALLTLMAVGLIWSPDSEKGRGLLQFAMVATPLGIGSLLRGRAEWMFAVHVFVYSSTAAAFYLFVDWRGQNFDAVDGRYGALFDESLRRTIEPNVTSMHLGFCIVLIASLLLATSGHRDRQPVSRTFWLIFPILVVLFVAGGSRGMTVAVLGALASVFALYPLHGKLNARFALVAMACVGLFIVSLVFVPTSPLGRTGSSTDVENSSTVDPSSSQRDASDPSTTGSVGNRLPIWNAGVDAWLEGPQSLVIGAGTGASDRSVATQDLSIPEVDVGEHGVARLDVHNGYLDWLIAFGLSGGIVAVAALAWLAWYGYGNDRLRRQPTGVALLIYFLLASLTIIAFRTMAVSIAMAAISFGYILSRDQRKENRLGAQVPSDVKMDA